ncbi:MAG: hypothetical protein AB1452_12185 [Pseudomonadota bacterium]
MAYNVSVKFGEGKVYEFKLQERDLAGSTPESARRWLEQKFHEFGCEPTNPTGKTLLVDKILGVAKAMGDQPFARNESAAREFAKHAVIAFEKSALSIDVSALSVG